MTQKPRTYARGKTGGINSVGATDLNAVVANIEATKRDVQQLRDPSLDVAFERPLIAQPTGSDALPGFPTDRRISWQLVFIDADDDHGAPAFPPIPFPPWSSTAPHGSSPYDVPGFPLVPPQGMIFPVRDSRGVLRPVYQPATQAYAVLLSDASGFPNGTYTVTAADLSFQYTNVTPVDRNSALTYSTSSQRGVLVIYNDATRDLYANEPFDTTSCPAPAAAPAASPVGNAEFLGL